MSFQPFLTTLSLLMLLALSCAHIGGNPAAARGLPPRHYCGRSLARALAVLCNDEHSRQKESVAGTMYNAVLAAYYDRKKPEILPWSPLHQTQGLGLLPRGQRYVNYECCDKACSVDELQSLC